MQSADCVPCSLQTAYLAPCSLQTAQVLRLHATYIRADQGRLRPARAYGFVFEMHQRSDFFVEKLYGMRVRALAVHALARSRGAARNG